MMGHPLPISYRDIVTELDRCPWPNKEQLEQWLTAMDDAYIDVVDKKKGTAS